MDGRVMNIEKSLWNLMNEVTFFCLVVFALFCVSPAYGALVPGEIPVTVDTGATAASEGVVLSSGIPFAAGQLPDVSALRLVDSNGNPVAAQFSKLVAWPDNSVKVALLSFQPTVSNSGSAYHSYKVLYGNTESVVNPQPANPIGVSHTSSEIIVQTGVARFHLSKERFTVFDQVELDVQGNGSYLPQMQAPGDLVFVDANTGNTFRSSLYTAADGYSLTVTDQGPLKTTILATGKAHAESGPNNFGANDLVTYKVWLTFHANSGAVQIKYTWIDDTPRSGPDSSAGGSWPAPPKPSAVKYVNLRSNYLEIPLTAVTASYAAGGDGATVHTGAVTGEKFLYQDATRSAWPTPAYTFSYSGVAEGQKAAGWMDLARGDAGVTLSIRNFSKNYPNKLYINEQGVLRAYVQPEESPNAMFSIAPGVAKTHDILLDFHRGTDSAEAAKKALLFDEIPVLRAGAEWYAQSQVFGPISAPDAFSAKWDQEIEKLFTCASSRANCVLCPVVYGKRDYGDYVGGFTTLADGSKLPNYFNQHYEDAHGWLLEYLRSGKKKYFNFAVPFAVHHYDLDVMHTSWPQIYPGYPAGMIHFHGSGEHEATKMEPGHIVPGGIDEYFLLTGDPRALEVSKEQGDWCVKYLSDGNGRIVPERAGDAVLAIEYERAEAWAQYTVTKTFESTNDLKYWNAATIAVKNTIDWWKMPNQAIVVYDATVPIDLNKSPQEQAIYFEPLDWTQGNGYFISTLRTANTATTSAPDGSAYWAYQNHVPIAWMAAYLESALIRYLENLKKMGTSYTGTMTYRGETASISVDAATLKDMISQTVKVLAEHNFESTLYPSKFPWIANLNNRLWVYSASIERVLSSPTSTDGNYQLPFALAYAASIPESEVSSALQSQWPAIQSKLLGIAKLTYDKYVTNYSMPGGNTGYNGAPMVWNMPYALGYLSSAFGPDTVAPTVSVTAPASGATVKETVSVSAAASDDVGVAKVEFYLDGVLKATDSTAPYAFSWSTGSVSDGVHSISAKAYDATGNVGTSAAVSVTVHNAPPDTVSPTVSLSAPASNATVSGTVPLSATASDNVAVTKVEFYLNGSLLDVRASAPYSTTWNSTLVPDGSYSISAKAYDAAGNVGTASRSVTVRNAADTTKPIVTAFSLPATAASTMVAVSSFTATDNVRVTGYLITESATAPLASAAGWSATAPTRFTFAGAGSRTAFAWAKDAAGNVSLAKSKAVLIDTTLPTIRSVSLGSGTAVVNIQASATDNIGVTKIQLYLDGVLKTQVAAPMVSYNWTVTYQGAHMLMVQAFDAAGNVRTQSVKFTR